jgi:hypothetical protein
MRVFHPPDHVHKAGASCISGFGHFMDKRTLVRGRGYGIANNQTLTCPQIETTLTIASAICEAILGVGMPLIEGSFLGVRSITPMGKIRGLAAWHGWTFQIPSGLWYELFPIIQCYIVRTIVLSGDAMLAIEKVDTENKSQVKRFVELPIDFTKIVRNGAAIIY